MTIYVGVDQALQKIGVCVLVDGTPDVLKLLKPPPKLTGPDRLQKLRDRLQTALEPYRGRITGSAVEGQSYGSLGDLDGLGQVLGVVQVLLTDMGAAPWKVPPALLKQFVTGKGNATKPQMRAATLTRWRLDIDQDDICDAHGLARIAEEIHEQASQDRIQVDAVRRLTHKKPRRPRLKKLFTRSL
jgi:Holliday junction resolvasome RuvABC endonuclease subunit